MTCHPCERGEHRFCAVGNCDFCPPCARAREQARTPNPEPTPEQAVRVLKILGEWTRRGFWYEVHGATSSDPGSMVIYNDLVVHDEAYYAGGDHLAEQQLARAFGRNHFDALCQATTAMQVLLELYPEPKAEKR